jgi:DNA-binding transcriptional ArsR family regulator
LSAATVPDVLGAVASRVRLEILMSLARATKDVSSLAEDLEFASHTVSHHLGILHAFRLVEYEPLGTRHIYRLGPRCSLTAKGGKLHLAVTGTEGLEFELRFPADKAIWWYPQPVTVGRCGLRGRVSG